MYCIQAQFVRGQVSNKPLFNKYKFAVISNEIKKYKLHKDRVFILSTSLFSATKT